MDRLKSLFSQSGPVGLSNTGPCTAHTYISFKTACDQPVDIPTFGTWNVKPDFSPDNYTPIQFIDIAN